MYHKVSRNIIFSRKMVPFFFFIMCTRVHNITVACLLCIKKNLWNLSQVKDYIKIINEITYATRIRDHYNITNIFFYENSVELNPFFYLFCQNWLKLHQLLNFSIKLPKDLSITMS